MRRVLIALLLLPALLVAALASYAALLFWNGGRGVFPPEGNAVAAARPAGALRAAAQRQASRRAQVGRAEASQVLFGDLHVHTVFSADAHLQSVRIRDRASPNPPADACDFARFCSQLDFWSINDHAESLTPALWSQTVEAIRECNAASGNPANPDLVSFLGWEWSHAATRAETHYGHKNVVLLEEGDGRVPTRPISSTAGPPSVFLGMGAFAPLVRGTLAPWASFHRYTRDVTQVPDCPAGFSVHELPSNCRESAPTPEALFAKLAEWDLPALVIPHGLSWGITNPVGADLAFQIEQHDPRWQRLLEVYSGHGNSEVYRRLEWPRETERGWSCPADGDGFENCCERAAVLARERCEDPGSAACDAEVAAARERAADSFGGYQSPVDAVAGTTLADWGECGQLQRAFLPAFNYRPRHSAQYAAALATAAEGAPTEKRLRWGYIGASDNHRSRPGTGYVEAKRLRWGYIGASDNHRSRPGTGYVEAEREIMTDGVRYPVPQGVLDTRGASYYYTGGLAAVHAEGRDRKSIFEALRARRVYATSGDRILLWFDLLAADGSRVPMGSEVALGGVPSFEVRAVGDFERQPGCPEFVGEALTPERIESLCRGHCYHPSDRRRRITRIEVVRIRTQAEAAESVDALIEDPWQSFACPASEEGCRVEFTDPEFPGARRETVYYARALQEPSLAVNGDPLRCERDDSGRCVRAHPCERRADGLPDDCLAPIQERAWSSPIYVDPIDPGAATAEASPRS
jgi:hypothetical protein